MDKSFENSIAEKLKDFNAEVSNSNWQDINKKLDEPFETALKSKIGKNTAPVSASVWAGIESALPGSLESKLQDKLSEHSAPVASSIWAGISSKVESMPGLFEESMQEKFSSFNATPPANAFNGIMAATTKTGSLSWKKTVASIAAVFLVFSTCLFLPKHTKKQVYSYNNGESVASFYNVNGNEQNSVRPINILNEEAALATGDDGFNSLETTNANYNSNASNANSDFASNNGGNSHINKDVFEGNNSSNTNVVFGSNNYSETFALNVPELGIASLSTGKNGYRMPNLAEFESNNAFVLEKANDKINIGLLSSTGSFAMNTSLNDAMSFYDESFSDFNSTINHVGIYQAIGADVSLAVAKKAKIVSGLHLILARNKMSFDIHSNSSAPSSYASLTDDGDVITNYFNPQANRLTSSKKNEVEAEFAILDQQELGIDSVIAGNKYTVSNKYTFVDLPIGFEFDLVKKTNTTITARIGSKLRLMAGANSYHLANNRKSIVEVSPAMSQAFYQTSAVGFASFSINKDLNTNYQLFIGPEVNINMTDINRMGTWMSMRPVQVGLNVGIRQKVS